MTTMLLGGLWHGANWTFVCWGGIHGCWLSLERFLGRPRKAVPSPAREWLSRIALFHLVCLTWIFFRAQSLRAAVDYLRGMAVLRWEPQLLPAFIFLATFTVPLFAMDLALENNGEEYLFQYARPGAQVLAALTAMLAVVMFSGDLNNAFIYFQF